MSADIVELGVENKRNKNDSVTEACEEMLRMAKSGQLRGVVIVGIMDEGWRTQSVFFDEQDASRMIGAVAIELNRMCMSQLKD